jgi:hypothetical protein
MILSRMPSLPESEDIANSFSSWLLKGFLPVALAYVPAAAFVYLHWPLFLREGAPGLAAFALLSVVVLASGLLLLSIAYRMFHPKPRIVITRSEIAQEAIDGIVAVHQEMEDLRQTLLASVEERLSDALGDVREAEQVTRGMQSDIMTSLLDKSAQVDGERSRIAKRIDAVEERFLALSHKDLLERHAEVVEERAKALTLAGAPDPREDFWSAWRTGEAVWRSELADWRQIGRLYLGDLEERLEANLSQGLTSGNWAIPAEAFPDMASAVEYRQFRLRYGNFQEARRKVDAKVRIAAYGQ